MNVLYQEIIVHLSSKRAYQVTEEDKTVHKFTSSMTLRTCLCFLVLLLVKFGTSCSPPTCKDTKGNTKEVGQTWTKKDDEKCVNNNCYYRCGINNGETKSSCWCDSKLCLKKN